MTQPNQNMMGLVLQSPAQNTHMLVNVAGSTGFIGQTPNSMNPMGNMVQMQPQNHPNLHPRPHMPPPLPTNLGNRASNENDRVLQKRHLQDLLQNIDPLGQLDDEVEEVLLQIGDDFLEDVISASAQIAAHRKSKQLEAKDVLLYLDRHHDLWLPGYSKEEFKPPKKDICTEQHKQRLEMIKKAQKQ